MVSNKYSQAFEDRNDLVALRLGTQMDQSVVFIFIQLLQVDAIRSEELSQFDDLVVYRLGTQSHQSVATVRICLIQVNLTTLTLIECRHIKIRACAPSTFVCSIRSLVQLEVEPILQSNHYLTNDII